ncbi:MAG: 1-acyl-sn-glycerol-3-phosphate acyltransferase [Thermoleophilaceae bacterium]|nr:1-acyl-sn-glycerol-3-phosphate acyltransferase [Thermoleophilaceae bacterium]
MPSIQSPADTATLSRHHERIRRRGVQPVVYLIVRAVLEPLIRIYFRVCARGTEHIPKRGAMILAANHRSFLDPFVIGVCVRRPIYFVAKRELFDKPLQGWLLNAVGAFPVRRGESDEEMVETALRLLAQGKPVVIFPEGTRIRRGPLGKPRRGVGRLALESGAPVVPVAVTGTENARRGWRIRPAKARLRFGRPLTFPRVEHPSPHLAGEVTARLWPCIQLQWEWLGGLPPARRAAIVGAGPMGTALATLFARAGLEVELGCRTAADCERVEAARERTQLPDSVKVVTTQELSVEEADVVTLAVPASALPAAVAQIGERIPERACVLAVSKGLVPPLGTRPSAYVGERVPARGVVVLGGPAHAAEAVEVGASVVLAGKDPHLRQQLANVLADAGLDVEQTDDVTGTELAGTAKNAAALAAAAAAPRGANAAGAAAARVFAEAQRLALKRGARPETFAGLAGAGDLVATALAEGSRNRRAGELLAQGLSAREIPAVLRETAEALETVPLLARQLGEEGLEASATARLAELVRGAIAAEEWSATVHGRRGRFRRGRVEASLGG